MTINASIIKLKGEEVYLSNNLLLWGQDWIIINAVDYLKIQISLNNRYVIRERGRVVINMAVCFDIGAFCAKMPLFIILTG